MQEDTMGREIPILATSTCGFDMPYEKNGQVMEIVQEVKKLMKGVPPLLAGMLRVANQIIMELEAKVAGKDPDAFVDDFAEVEELLYALEDEINRFARWLARMVGERKALTIEDLQFEERKWWGKPEKP
jgi:hypothetical protein